MVGHEEVEAGGVECHGEESDGNEFIDVEAPHLEPEPRHEAASPDAGQGPERQLARGEHLVVHDFLVEHFFEHVLGSQQALDDGDEQDDGDEVAIGPHTRLEVGLLLGPHAVEAAAEGDERCR